MRATPDAGFSQEAVAGLFPHTARCYSLQWDADFIPPCDCGALERRRQHYANIALALTQLALNPGSGE